MPEMPNASPHHFGSSRRLLKILRDLMAEVNDAQTRLDHMVTQIAGEMVADVCSIYLKRHDGVMELCATEGLSLSAVHNTRLKPSEGLVGLVAETAQPLSLSDAPQHKRFSYRPETGEDPYQSFLGVPMLKGGRLLGVLVVQNRTKKSYPEEDIDTLQTIATVLAEIVSQSEIVQSLQDFDIKPSQTINLSGKTFAGGLAYGLALLHAPVVAATRLLADDPEAEEERMLVALKALRQGLEILLTGDGQNLGAVPLEVLEMIFLLSQDRGWEKRLIEGVRAGLTAEASVEQVRSEHRARMQSAKDAYLRDRLHDLEELDNRLLRHLSGVDNSFTDFEGDAILVARDIGPAELLEYSKIKLRAILLEEGSSSSHAAIIARAMGIPMMGQIKGLIANVGNSDPIIVDGESSAIYCRYDPIIVDAFSTRFNAQREEKRRVRALKDLVSQTQDGKRIKLMMNAGLVLDLNQMDVYGAEGVGLFRTEFQFLVSNSFPRVDAQTALYEQVFGQSGNKPITFRTLDLGGDKIARFMQGEKEENPAMGWRALRLGLDRKAILVHQLRALIRAGGGHNLKIMFPLVSIVEEFLEAKKILTRELELAKKAGRTLPKSIEIGTMIESPSIAWDIKSIAKHADFLSIGTNDLMQFFYAADRGSAKVGDRYDILSRPALTFMSHIISNCGNVPISVCGEHAGRPIEALALIGLGYDCLSMPISSIGPIKELVLSINHQELQHFTLGLLQSNCENFRQEFTNYAKAKKLNII